jgi:hypothetical protein
MTAFLFYNYITGIQNPAQESLGTHIQSSDISGAMMMKFFSKYFFRHVKSFFLLFIIILFYPSNFYCQIKSNLDVFYSLTNSLVDKICSELPADEKKLILVLNLGQSYSVFSNTIQDRFLKSGKEILQHPIDELNFPTINIVMEGAGVEYGEMFREGFFGTHYVQRYETIFGNYMLSLSEKGQQKFEITKIDTVKVEDINSLQNESFPFTQGTIPPEPFLSGFAEPIIAIGTAALVVVLFFTIRSE